MSTTTLSIGLMVFFAYFLSLQFRKTNIPDYSLRDAAITSMLAPKGLAAAVLAALPLQYGVIGGGAIRDTTYMVVLVSITFTALLVMVYPRPAMQELYGRALNKHPPSRA